MNSSGNTRVKTEIVEQEALILVPKISLNNKDMASKKKLINFDKKWKKILGIGTAVIVAGLVVLSLLFYLVYKDAMVVKANVTKLIDAGKSQDLVAVKEGVGLTKESLDKLKSSYSRISWLSFVPWAGNYVKDGSHIINAGDYGLDAAKVFVETIEPYADVLGFSTDVNVPQSGEESAQDRLDFIVKSLPDIIPKTDILAEKVKLAHDELSQIEAARYPENFAGKSPRSRLESVLDNENLIYGLVVNGKPLIKNAPYILGVDEPRTYMVIFQNDKELRPTGGFITAYSIAKVDKGRFEPVVSSDIYNLDEGYTPKVTAAEPIVKYLKGPYLLSNKYKLRDMNWSPDFSNSMELFLKEAETAGISKVDGIIAVDTQMLVDILDAIGPIGVSGFGNFSTDISPECNCPQVIYELESFADIEGPVVWSQDEPGKIIYAPANYDNRKKIIGPLMNSILANALGQPKDKIPGLFGAVMKSLLEKHALFYLTDKSAEEAVSSFGIGGTISSYDGDYLHINDANLGGRKSNLYVTQEVNQTLDVGKDGLVTKTLEIIYKNPERQDGWLNSILPNWVRVYVPKGSELISIEGLDNKPDPYEELGKTVYAGYFELRPQGVAKVTIKYKLAFKITNEYDILIQKQPGTNAPSYSVTVGKNTQEFLLKQDKELKLKI